MKLKLLLILFFPLSGFNQTPTIDVYDLYVIPSFGFIVVDTIETHDTTIYINPGFKIDNLADADSVFFNVGTTDGGYQTESLKFKVILSAGIYSLDDGIRTIQIY